MDVFDYADKLLGRFSDKLPDQLEINEDSFACVDNLLKENVFFPNYECHKLIPGGKSEKLASDYRAKGNEKFRSRKFFSALWFYNQSLCYATPDSDSLGLAFANRSAVYAEIDEFEMCIQNIQWARIFNYPKSKLEKLKRREDVCSKLSREKSAGNKSLQLSHEASLEFPFAVAALRVKSDSEFGRHVVTERKLNAGDVIVIEEPFVALLTSHSSYKRCTNCLGQFSLNLLPCPTCTSGKISIFASEGPTFINFSKIICFSDVLLEKLYGRSQQKVSQT